MTSTVNNTDHVERPPNDQLERWLRELCAPTKTDPWVHRHTPHYDEVTRILGPTRAWWIADEKVRQINGKWLKADQFIKDENGEHKLNADGTDILTVASGSRVTHGCAKTSSTSDEPHSPSVR